jgi:hypothetical protein
MEGKKKAYRSSTGQYKSGKLTNHKEFMMVLFGKNFLSIKPRRDGRFLIGFSIILTGSKSQWQERMNMDVFQDTEYEFFFNGEPINETFICMKVDAESRKLGTIYLDKQKEHKLSKYYWRNTKTSMLKFIFRIIFQNNLRELSTKISPSGHIIEVCMYITKGHYFSPKSNRGIDIDRLEAFYKVKVEYSDRKVEDVITILQ